MKIIALIDALAKEARAQVDADIEAVLTVVEDEITPIKQNVAELREDVDALMSNP